MNPGEVTKRAKPGTRVPGFIFANPKLSAALSKGFVKIKFTLRSKVGFAFGIRTIQDHVSNPGEVTKRAKPGMQVPGFIFANPKLSAALSEGLSGTAGKCF